jgi:hypothetical protein
MTPSLPALALALSLPLVAPHHTGDEQSRHQRIGAWSLTVTHDRFAAETKCRLSTHGLDFQREALVARLPSGVDTSSAAYRVDDSPPREVGADTMELAHMGFALHQDDLDNPSGGVVRVPAHLLTGAGRLTVQARPGGRIWSFKVAGLDAALDAARAAGCGPASFK